MAVTPIRPKPFFEDKNRAFWYLQIAGWLGLYILRAASALANDNPLSSLILYLIPVITGFSVTLLMSVIFRWLLSQRPLVTWTVSILVLLCGTGLGAFIDAWVTALKSGTGEPMGVTLFLGAFYLNLIPLGAWSALYYAINFFLTIEQQADQLRELEIQASTAQLAMLRYQLNPHFLFNTLNSISTLVLLKQTDKANAMLSRLSSFLRYTLINEPAAQVTLAQEVETLKLYLDIEKMRFEDRLRPSFAIDDSVANVLLPSLLLQPLVENAIKYAVTPQEDGAEIVVTAQPAGENVRIVVSDSGPGLNPVAVRPSLSTGVGLANIRDRLVQAYGERQSFETSAQPGGGFMVAIEIPNIAEETTKVAA